MSDVHPPGDASEIAILGRVLGGLTPEAAEAILNLTFPPADLARMQHLAEKARDGTLSGPEREEIASYETVGHEVSLLKSRLRRILDPLVR